MKKIQVKTNHVALVFKNQELQNIYLKGNHFIWGNKQVEQFDLSCEFNVGDRLDTLLLNPSLADLLEIVHVLDNEIALVFKDQVFQRVLAPGKYAFFKASKSFSFQKYDISQIDVDASISRTISSKQAMSSFIRTFSVAAYEKGLLFVDGEFKQILDAGEYRFWNNDIKIQVQLADIRSTALEISGQEILTKDKVQLRVNFALSFQVVDIAQFYIQNKDTVKQLYSLVQLALRQKVGMLSFDELMDNKDGISQDVLLDLEKSSKDLGLVIHSCGIRDIILPGDIRSIMNQVLIAEKKAQANMITRREETASTRSLLNTAKLMEENQMLMRLKEMEFMEKIAEKVGDISLNGGGSVLGQFKELFTK